MLPSRRLPRSAWTVLLDQTLAGLRHGGVPQWPVNRWPRLKRRVEQQWLGPIWGTLGDQIGAQERWPAAVNSLFQWACGLIRPDHQFAFGLSRIPETAWVEQTAWRPLIALAATSSMLQIPNVGRHYRRSPGESPIDTLCGLWAVGSSTAYRYVEKGRKSLVEGLWLAQTNPQHRWALREISAGMLSLSMTNDWHVMQAQSLAQHGHSMDAAWHLCKARQYSSLADLMRRRAPELASSVEYPALIDTVHRFNNVDANNKVELALAESVLWRCLGNTNCELSSLQLAMRTSQLQCSEFTALNSGKALYAIGYFYNARNPDQSISHLEAAAQEFVIAAKDSPLYYHNEVQSAYIATLALLAFVQLRRNSPQAHALLRDALRSAQECVRLSVDAHGMLLKAQAEEARCLDRMDEALRYRQQTLVLFERSGNLGEIIEAKNNLGQLLAHMGNAAEAMKCCLDVIELAQEITIRPETLVSAHGGAAVAAMTVADFDVASIHLQKSLYISREAGLPLHDLASLTNLAELHYMRFKANGDVDDEKQGDHYVEQSRSLAKRLGLPQMETKAQSLKQATLNPQTATHHLLPIETSAHPGEFAKIEALRAELALPRPPAQRARTHIALSQLYLRIAAKERDAARGLMQTHGLSDLESELEALQLTWVHDGNLASQLNQRWREQVGDWLTDAQRKAVLARLLEEGSLSKSSYGEAAEVSPATASKHLGLLADKGLLEQQGRGPATRYVLPAATASSGGVPAAPPVH